jgi:uncharacterized protein YdaU (DUF1376 family)
MFYATDWRSDRIVRRMSREQRGDYMDLQAASWLSEEPGTLPLPYELAAKECGMSTRTCRKFVESFPEVCLLDGDSIVFPRLREYWHELQERRENQSLAGQRGNEKRWGKSSQPDSGPDRSSSSSSSSLSIKEEEKNKPLCSPNPGERVDESFDSFWKAYPKRVAKKAAIKAWKKIKPEHHQAILKAVAAWSRDENWTKDNGQFIPYPASWLNDERWNDIPQSVVNQNAQEENRRRIWAIRHPDKPYPYPELHAPAAQQGGRL